MCVCVHACMYICVCVNHALHCINPALKGYLQQQSQGVVWVGGGHAYVCMNVCVCMCLCVRAHVCVHMHAYMFERERGTVKSVSCYQPNSKMQVRCVALGLGDYMAWK